MANRKASGNISVASRKVRKASGNKSVKGQMKSDMKKHTKKNTAVRKTTGTNKPAPPKKKTYTDWRDLPDKTKEAIWASGRSVGTTSAKAAQKSFNSVTKKPKPSLAKVTKLKVTNTANKAKQKISDIDEAYTRKTEQAIEAGGKAYKKATKTVKSTASKAADRYNDAISDAHFKYVEPTYDKLKKKKKY